MQFFEKNEKNEKNEMNEFMLKDAMKNCKLESSRKDAIWEQIRAKRSEYSTRGSRRHLEKIIVGYICAALVFTLSVTVGASLWSNVTEGESPNPAGARPTNQLIYTSGDPNTHAPIIAETKSIWGDKEGVEDFVKLLNSEKGWENDPMNMPHLNDVRNALEYEFKTTYSAENILRIHSSDLEGQDEFQIYQQYGDEPISWILYRGETICPLLQLCQILDVEPSIGQSSDIYVIDTPCAFYDITLVKHDNGSQDLLVLAYSSVYEYSVDWNSDDTKSYYYKKGNEDHVSMYSISETIIPNPNSNYHISEYYHLIEMFDLYDTNNSDEFKDYAFVIQNRSDNNNIIDIMLANPNFSTPYTVTGSFSYESRIEKRYTSFEYDFGWIRVDPPIQLPPVTTEPIETQPDVTTAPEPITTTTVPTVTTEPVVPPVDPPVEDFENEQGLLLRKSPWRDSYLVVGIGSCKDTDLVIPGSYNGLPLSIGSYAFEDCEGLVSVTLSEGIYEIGSGAFQKIDSLTSITIPSTVGTVGDNAFWGCTNLESVTIAEGVLRYGAEVFFGCRSLKTITIPKGAEYIGEWIFDDCDSLTDVYYGGSKEEWEYAADGVELPDHATLHFGE